LANIKGRATIRGPISTDALILIMKAGLDPEGRDGQSGCGRPDCAVTDYCGCALYFSRSPIPFGRDAAGNIQYYKHIGLYAYTRAALALFHKLPQSPLEQSEKLEQLRFLENGVTVMVVETPHDTVGVDTEADLKRAAAFLLAE
jgi:3-deoxy-manno-octulosonate cytidylyltransferase (CMP-KDO synthetase)